MKNDLIERKAAIEAMGKAQWAKERLMELPSAQPELSDAVYQLWKRAYEAGERSTQPKIVRCKDCEYCVPGYITDSDDFIPPRCGRLRQTVRISGDDYCSFGERRTDGSD